MLIGAVNLLGHSEDFVYRQMDTHELMLAFLTCYTVDIAAYTKAAQAWRPEMQHPARP